MSKGLSEAQQKLRALPEFQLPPWPAYFVAADKWEKDAEPWHQKWHKVPAGLRRSMIVRFRLGPPPAMPNAMRWMDATLKLCYLPGIEGALNSSSILWAQMKRAA